MKRYRVIVHLYVEASTKDEARETARALFELQEVTGVCEVMEAYALKDREER